MIVYGEGPEARIQCRPSEGGDGNQGIITIDRGEGRTFLDITASIVIEPDTIRDDILINGDPCPMDGRVEVSLQAGQQRTTLEVQAIADDFPEIEEAFQVIIVGGKSYHGRLSLNESADTINGVIAASDDARGLFSIREFRPRMVSEGETVVLNISRSGGSLTSVNVYWAVDEVYKNDTHPSRGFVTFPENVTVAPFNFTVLRDERPEIVETITVSLIKGEDMPSGASIDESGASTSLTIRNSNKPYGVFEIDPASTKFVVRKSAPSSLGGKTRSPVSDTRCESGTPCALSTFRSSESSLPQCVKPTPRTSTCTDPTPSSSTW